MGNEAQCGSYYYCCKDKGTFDNKYGTVLEQKNSNVIKVQSTFFKHVEEEVSAVDLHKKRDYWVTIYNLKTNNILKPVEISPVKEKKVLSMIQKYYFEVVYEELSYTVEDYFN